MGKGKRTTVYFARPQSESAKLDEKALGPNGVGVTVPMAEKNYRARVRLTKLKKPGRYSVKLDVLDKTGIPIPGKSWGQDAIFGGYFAAHGVVDAIAFMVGDVLDTRLSQSGDLNWKPKRQRRVKNLPSPPSSRLH